MVQVTVDDRYQDSACDYHIWAEFKTSELSGFLSAIPQNLNIRDTMIVNCTENLVRFYMVVDSGIDAVIILLEDAGFKRGKHFDVLQLYCTDASMTGPSLHAWSNRRRQSGDLVHSIVTIPNSLKNSVICVGVAEKDTKQALKIIESEFNSIPDRFRENRILDLISVKFKRAQGCLVEVFDPIKDPNLKPFIGLPTWTMTMASCDTFRQIDVIPLPEDADVFYNKLKNGIHPDCLSEDFDKPIDRQKVIVASGAANILFGINEVIGIVERLWKDNISTHTILPLEFDDPAPDLRFSIDPLSYQ